MKKLVTLVVLLTLAIQSQAIHRINWTERFQENTDVQAVTPDMGQLALDKFLDMTPAKYRELTGERMGVKKALQMKAAQTFIKKELKSEGSSDISEGLYILLAILGLGWVAMGILDDWDGKNWITCLILSLLCWLPGLIYALTKKGDYY